MTACPSLTYAVTPEQWTAIKSAVCAKIGIAITVDAGSATSDGFTIAWIFASGDLTLTATDSPWWASCSMINGEIDGLVRPLLG